MTYAAIRGVRLNYEIVGTSGPAMALISGSRTPLSEARPLARAMAARGYRVLIHDRRNCGISDISFDASQSEFGVWVDDLHELLAGLGMLPAILGGTSSGARTVLTFALRYRQDVRALLLWRVTGGAFAVRRLVEKYYDLHARTARAGGMAAVAETEHYAELIGNRPDNRERLLAVAPADFIACMETWKTRFLAGRDMPLIGISEADLGSLTIPVSIVAGDDLTHPRVVAERAAQLIPGCQYTRVSSVDQEVDVSAAAEWHGRATEMAEIYARFLAERLPQSPGAGPGPIVTDSRSRVPR